MAFYLGLDGGGSNVTVMVSDEKGQVLYDQTEAGGANYHALGIDVSIANIETAIMGAVHRIDLESELSFEQAVLGLAGCNFDDDIAAWQEALNRSSVARYFAQPPLIVNDTRIALQAGTSDGVGVVLIAGTGSNCFGRRADGREARAGGVDYILSDEGSGYDIGLRALRATTQALDGRAERTLLSRLIMETVGVNNLSDLHKVVYAQYTRKPAIASLSIMVSRAAEEGDIAAQAILNHSVAELLHMVDAVLQQLDWRDAAVPVVQAGSVLHQPYMANRLAA